MTKQVDEHTHMLTDMAVDYLKRTVASLKDTVKNLEERLEKAETNIKTLEDNDIYFGEMIDG